MAEVKTEQRRPMMPKGPMRGRGMPVPKGAIKKGTLGRLIKTVFKYYKTRIIVALIFLAFSSVGSLVSTVYMKGIVSDVIEPALAKDPVTGVMTGLTPELRTNLIGLVVMMIIAVVERLTINDGWTGIGGFMMSIVFVLPFILGLVLFEAITLKKKNGYKTMELYSLFTLILVWLLSIPTYLYVI